ncbi:uncharacterized protein LOC127624671 isoform X3 [Xyrauchen texanus]|uniref:uncharacterized protein LOC127624671 isoform X3 n=1 Tax=Xyrauchen texanus TaxID=154827 RepID=UPI0022420559|nr:uncharacterized protein LOC127624671 isoform X3 [Xyrauchen texanus]
MLHLFIFFGHFANLTNAVGHFANLTNAALSGEQTLVVLVILGTLILVFLLMIITQIVYMAKQQGCRRKFSPARAQNLDTGTQDANPGPAEKQETVKTEVVEDELLYATVNHLAENSVLAVKFESGTDYATVVIN